MDRREEKQYKLSPDVKIPTFEVKDKATGDTITVDDRTFDPELHEKFEAEEKKKGKGKDK